MSKKDFFITVIDDSNLMAKYIRESDFVITANGRTVFEIASLNVPMITISVNKHEELHPFSKHSGGGIHLGIYQDLKPISFYNAIKKMLNYKFRIRLVNNLKKHNLLKGVDEITNIINREFNDKNY